MNRLPPDDELVARIRGRDEAVFALLLDAWSAGMRRLAGSYLASGATADEVVQDTWLAVITSIDSFEGRASLKHWVYRILVNTAKRRALRDSRVVPAGSMRPDAHPGDDGPTVDPARFRAADQTYPGHWAELPAPWPSPEQEVLAGEVRRRVAGAVERLPAQQRAVITLRDIEGYGSVETCALLDLTPANQRVLLHRARAAVRADLETYLSSARNEPAGS
ncbi:MAG: RNA polymerase sigma factor [Nocardioidaceae bacterium]